MRDRDYPQLKQEQKNKMTKENIDKYNKMREKALKEIRDNGKCK